MTCERCKNKLCFTDDEIEKFYQHILKADDELRVLLRIKRMEEAPLNEQEQISESINKPIKYYQGLH